MENRLQWIKARPRPKQVLAFCLGIVAGMAVAKGVHELLLLSLEGWQAVAASILAGVAATAAVILMVQRLAR